MSANSVKILSIIFNYMSSPKIFTLVVEIKDTNTPQSWTFDNITGIEQLAVWQIIKHIAEKNINNMLDPKPE